MRIRVGLIVLTAVVTGVVSVAGALLVGYLQERGPRLEHRIVASPLLSVQGENRRIFQIVLKNSGKHYAENTSLRIEVSPGSIEVFSVQAEPASQLSKRLSPEGDAVFVDLPLMNPGDEVTVSMLATMDEQDKLRGPAVSARAKGVTSRLLVDSGEKQDESLLRRVAPAMVGAYGGLAAVLSILTLRRRFRLARAFLPEMEGSRHGDEQRHILAYVLGSHGLFEDSERVGKGRGTTYWAEADRQLMLARQFPDSARVRRDALRSLLRYARIAEGSVGMIHCDIACICSLMGDSDGAREHLTQALELCPKRIKARSYVDSKLKDMMIDPAVNATAT